MKKITSVFSRILFGLLTAALLLLSTSPVQAQSRRLIQKQVKKLEKQTATPATKSQTPEPVSPTPIQSETQQNRPNIAGLQPANPRLQAVVLDRFLPRLDLTDEQRKQIQLTRLQHIRRLRTLLDIERAHTRAYDEALFDLSIDTKEVEKRAAQLAEVRTDMLNAQAKFFLELRKLLTPEQFTKLRQLMDEERAFKRAAP